MTAVEIRREPSGLLTISPERLAAGSDPVSLKILVLIRSIVGLDIINESRLSAREVDMADKKEARDRRAWPPEDVREHVRSARKEMRKSMEMLVPPEFIEHRRAARKEMLLAVRALIDHAIDRTQAES
jgi:hypothetical protein